MHSYPLNVPIIAKTIILAVGNDQVIDELYAEQGESLRGCAGEVDVGLAGT